jgi:hypothetical protein
MLNELRLVDLVERAYADRPYCECGRQTVTTYRGGAMWLECAIVREPIQNRLHRMWNVVTEPGHVHSVIAEIPQPEALAA